MDEKGTDNTGSLSGETNSGPENWQYTLLFNEEYSRKVLPVSVVFGLTAFVGFFANILVVYIYGLRYKQCNFKHFLFVMGVIGIVQCSIMLPTQMAEMHYWFVFPTSWLCRGSAYVFGYTVIACYLVLLLIAVDRYRKVCRPYEWQIQSRTARNLCVLVSILSLVFALPPGIISGNHTFRTSYYEHNITVTVCSTDDMFQDRDWAVLILFISGGIPVAVIILVTCVLYGLILKQFYQGPAITLKSHYNSSALRVNDDASDKGTNHLPVPSTDDGASSTTCKSSTDIKTDVQVKIYKKSTLRKVMDSIFNRQGSINADKPRSGPLRTSGSNMSKKGVRNKLMRKTLIVLIITITCIIALILTFCLHIVAEDINNNVQKTSVFLLNAFVIFHRGSFSIICAIFPIIYGLRDPKFRQSFRQMCILKKSAQKTLTIAQNEPQNASVC